MIQVKVYSANDNIQTVTISGHANSRTGDELDMVCAEVSAISVGTLNAIDQLTNKSCVLEMDSGWIQIDVKENSDTLQIILKTLLIQLNTVEYKNSKFIKIEKVEV